MSTGNEPVSRRYLNVQLDATKTEINLKNCQRMGDLRRAIKTEFSTRLADVEPSLIYLELPSGERVKKLSDIPDVYFIEDTEYLKIKWDSTTGNEPRYLNLQFKAAKTQINLKDVKNMRDLQDVIKVKFGEDLPAPSSRIYLELPDGEYVADLDGIPDEYFLKPKDLKSKNLTVKWEFEGLL
jgi:hypothetical protein